MEFSIDGKIDVKFRSTFPLFSDKYMFEATYSTMKDHQKTKVMCIRNME